MGTTRGKTVAKVARDTPFYYPGDKSEQKSRFAEFNLISPHPFANRKISENL